MIPDNIKEVLPVPEEQLIVLMKFGSHLYGTDTPESDTDYKGIYMPTHEQVLLGNIPKAASYHSKPSNKDAKNTKDDIDIQIFSLHYFLDLACKGETVSLDMLHAPDDWPDIATPIWKNLRKHRRRFYTKSLKSFVSYARKQAAKYGIKGSRLSDAKKVCHYFDKMMQRPLADIPPGPTILADVWDGLPEGEHIHKIFEPKSSLWIYQVCGKKFQETAKVAYVRDILFKFWNNYGHRAKLSEKNEGIDWKAVSHALRAAMQVCQLLLWSDIKFPLRAAEYLKEVKLGKRDYTTEVAPVLELFMDQCERLAAMSELPEKVDRKFWDKWLIKKLSAAHHIKHEQDIGNPNAY